MKDYRIIVHLTDKDGQRHRAVVDDLSLETVPGPIDHGWATWKISEREGCPILWCTVDGQLRRVLEDSRRRGRYATHYFCHEWGYGWDFNPNEYVMARQREIGRRVEFLAMEQVQP